MKILLIDDDIDCLKSLAEFLECEGYSIDSYAMPERALEAYLKGSYDVVITDLVMPGISGYEVIKVVTSINPFVNVIVISSFVQQSLITSLITHKVTYIGKPVNINKLIKTINALR